MRLSKIRIAGFKSFVDPVTLELRSNLTGILGPNGCGKSNTIDAVRWVMGETSAKNLRGASMEDVIFNGSATRKPVGVASVELVFDNSDGKLGGEYAKYAEIAIKRQVSRAGDSQYFLNGQKCRRRDITDIFLGTGLGARSYAIIEQGMISRLIEAKPEELRTTLEEAAGISRYKERRRETETRMAHTRENLDRLNDLRDELGKQLERLDKQAKAAQRFRELRDTERKLDASVILLQWQALQTTAAQCLQALSACSHLYQEQLAQVEAWNAQVSALRAQYSDATASLNDVQGEYYQATADIARLEQSLQHQRDLQRRQQEALRQVEHSLAETLQHVAADRSQLQQAEANLLSLEPQVEELTAQLQLAEATLAAAEADWHDWQEQWHASQQRIAEPTRQAQVEKTRMEQLERQLQHSAQRLERLQQEAATLAHSQLSADIALQETQLAELTAALAATEEQLTHHSGEWQQHQHALRESQAQLDQVRAQRQAWQGRLASLDALQQAGLDKLNQARSHWLHSQGLAAAARLAEVLKVKPGWETAVESVLAEDLDSVCVEELRLHDSLPQAGITLLDIASSASCTLTEESDSQPCAYLASKIDAPEAARSLVAGIRCAETLREAFSKRHRLAPGESIITREGVWVGQNWLRQRRQQDAHHGILQRQQEITQLRHQLAALEVQLAELHTQSDMLHASIRAHEQQRQQLQAEVNRLHRQVAEQRARLHGLQQRREQLTSRQQQLASEIAELSDLQAEHQAELLLATEARNAALAALEAAQQDHASLSLAREECQQAVNHARQQQRELQQALQAVHLALETHRQQRNHSQQQLERLHSRVAQLEQQRDELVEQLHLHADPSAELQLELETAQETRLQVEQRLNQARQTLQTLEASIRQQDQHRLQAERTAEQTRNALESRKLEWQALQVREQTFAEQFAKTEYDAAQLQAELHASETTLVDLQAQLDTVQRSIQRLGAINLAAIDEFREHSERKQYLDQQHADLTAALETLETAIRKIDRETRARFKETFEWVNQRLGEMFPRLFGGGECYLEMTGDDLLTTGVTIMARPPGKRIASIYLLSGGEKALTAVALVFAIFELNPAPFCMLDEVDAPLDEANVGRFCELVRHMAERVQFIFITHNKTTMELADNLIGVTMREAGVSRLVAVDVAETIKLANS